MNQPICGCNSRQTTTAPSCPVHGVAAGGGASGNQHADALARLRQAFDEIRGIVETCDEPERLYGSHANVYAQGIEAGQKDSGAKLVWLEAELARVTAELQQERETSMNDPAEQRAERYAREAGDLTIRLVAAERRAAQAAQDLQTKTAECIARHAHEGQQDTVTGEPYIRHVERVVALVDGDEAKAVAWLHDVLEDTLITAVDLKAAGISERVIAAVDLLTRIPHQPYEQYIADLRLSGNPLALAVKRADLQDHLRPNCPDSLRPRYEKAAEALAAVRPEGE